MVWQNVFQVEMRFRLRQQSQQCASLNFGQSNFVFLLSHRERVCLANRGQQRKYNRTLPWINGWEGDLRAASKNRDREKSPKFSKCRSNPAVSGAARSSNWPDLRPIPKRSRRRYVGCRLYGGGSWIRTAGATSKRPPVPVIVSRV